MNDKKVNGRAFFTYLAPAALAVGRDWVRQRKLEEWRAKMHMHFAEKRQRRLRPL